MGHPLLDSVRRTMSRGDFCRLHQIKPDNILLGILPGSRKKEIRAMLPVFLETAERLREIHANLSILLPLAPSLTMEDLIDCGLNRQKLDIKVITEDRYDLMASCDLVIAASGTVTLELAILDVPMVVAYKVSPLTWFVGNMLVKVNHASLVNLIAGREVVKELMQDEATPENISSALQDIFPGSVKRQGMLHDLAEVRRKLGGEGASMRAAQLALATAR